MRKSDLLFVLFCVVCLCSCGPDGPEGPDGYCKKYDEAVEIVVGSSNRIDSVQFFLNDEQICMFDWERKEGYKGWSHVYKRYEWKGGGAYDSVYASHCIIGKHCDKLQSLSGYIKVIAYYPDTTIQYDIGNGGMFNFEANSLYSFFYTKDIYPPDGYENGGNADEFVVEDDDKWGSMKFSNSLMCIDYHDLGEDFVCGEHR